MNEFPPAIHKAAMSSHLAVWPDIFFAGRDEVFFINMTGNGSGGTR